MIMRVGKNTMILLRMVRNVFMYPAIFVAFAAVCAGVVWILYNYLPYVIGGVIVFVAVMKLYDDSVQQLEQEGAFQRLESGE